jgi:hypothetical protein
MALHAVAGVHGLARFFTHGRVLPAQKWERSVKRDDGMLFSGADQLRAPRSAPNAAVESRAFAAVADSRLRDILLIFV